MQTKNPKTRPNTLQRVDLFEAGTEVEEWSTSAIDRDDYKSIIKKLKTKNVTERLEALKQFVNLHLLDMKVTSWEQLSEQLQHCLSTTNDELFSLALKAHYKIICTQTLCSDGYISLVKGLVAIVYHKVFTNQVKLDFRNGVQNHVLQISGLIFKMQKFFLRSCAKIKLSSLEVFVEEFAKLITSPKVEVLMGIWCVLDRKANWFCNLCCRYQFRNLLFRKINTFVCYEINCFLSCLDDLNTLETKQCCSYNVFLAQFSHSIYFLAELLKYNASNMFFPIKSNITIDTIFESVLLKLRDSDKYNENTTNLLLHITKELSKNNQIHLNTTIISLLIESINENPEKSFKQLQTKKYILDIINSKKSSEIFFEPSNNLARTIIETTIHHIRSFINKIEYEHQLPEIIIDLLTTCHHLFSTFSRSSSTCSPRKLILATRDLYVASSNYNVNAFYKLELSRILCDFIVTCNEACKVLYERPEIIFEVVQLKVNNDRISNGNLIVLLSVCEFERLEILTNYHDYVLKEFLAGIRVLYESDVEFLEECHFKKIKIRDVFFVNVIFALSLSSKLSKAFLNFRTENVADGYENPKTIFEIIQFSLKEETGFLPEAIIGLLVIKILISNLELLLYLESSFNLKNQLTNLQVISELKNPLIIDVHTSIRQNILLSIGYTGCVEEILLKNILNQTQLVTSLPDNSILHEKSQNELQKFLNSTRNGLHDNGWILQARKIFRNTCSEVYKPGLVLDLIKFKLQNTIEQKWIEIDNINLELNEEYEAAVSMIVRFGVLAGFIHSTRQSEQILRNLIKQSKFNLNVSCDGKFEFDWFLAVIFLIACGNPERTKMALIGCTKMRFCPIVWFMYGRQRESDTVNLFYENLDAVLKENLVVHTALQRIGLTPKIIVRKWICQCFFNVLQFSEICNYLAICVLFPQDYLLYYFAAVFKHIEPYVCEASQENSVENIITLTQLPEFRLCKYFHFMDQLSKRYKNSV